MPANTNPHGRAVELFEALLHAPVTRHCRRPADVLDKLGRANSTAYRALDEVEATGLVQRDLNKSYRRGLLARRIGFSALGFGAIADVAEPVLTDLREALRLTALFGVVNQNQLLVGPYSLGRGFGYVRPTSDYRLAAAITEAPIFSTSLISDETGIHAVYARARVVNQKTNALCILAVLSTQPFVGPVAGIDEALTAFSFRMAESCTE